MQAGGRREHGCFAHRVAPHQMLVQLVESLADL
jgi:hypothetical protein